MKTTQLKDELSKNLNLIKDIVGIPSNFKIPQITMDNIFIVFHRKKDDYLLMVSPDKWESFQNSGEIAEGVGIINGDKNLVVALTETSLYWSSASVFGGGKTTADRMTAIGDWTDKTNTKTQITHDECNGASYAPGFCSKYSCVNANGVGLTAGRWWLPSIAELVMIYANMYKINYALSLINGATQLHESPYWSSTEMNENFAWYFYFSDGGVLYGVSKYASRVGVRPISHI